MTIIESLWMATLGVAVVLAVVDMFIGWLDDSIRVTGIIAMQWLALFLQAIVMTVILGKG